jgi:hypothetical protein
MSSSRPSAFRDPSTSSPIPLLHLTSPSSPPITSTETPIRPPQRHATSTISAAPLRPAPPFPEPSLAHLPHSRPSPKSRTNTTTARNVPWARLQSILYLSSFYIFILVISVLLVASALGLGEQAWHTGGERRWDIVILVAAYIALVRLCISP